MELPAMTPMTLDRRPGTCLRFPSATRAKNAKSSMVVTPVNAECNSIGHCILASTSSEALVDFALLWASREPALVAQQHREWFP
jgi:hypothetical protein